MPAKLVEQRLHLLALLLQMRPTHLRQTPRRARDHALRAVAREVAQEPSVQETHVHALAGDAWPFVAPEPPDARPVLDFERAHTV